MPVAIACTHCHSRLKLADELIGRRVKCPKCGETFRPTADGQEAVSAAPLPPRVPAPREEEAEDDRPRSKSRRQEGHDEVRPTARRSQRDEDEREEDEDEPRVRRRRDDDDDEERPRRRSPDARATEDEEDEDDQPRAGKGKDKPRLKSLAQSARGGQLTTARRILIIIGVLYVLIHVGLLFLVRGQIELELRRQGAGNLPPAEMNGIVLFAYAILSLFALMGVVFIVLGILVKRYPVPCTVGGMVIYLLGVVGNMVLEPRSLVQGVIFKVIIIGCLIKAIQAAIAYERERRSAAHED
jgi:predicted Zn finger-like uncharacterized protein